MHSAANALESGEPGMLVGIGHLRKWLGRVQEERDIAAASKAAALAATLDAPAGLLPGNTLPPLWHWTCFLPVAPQRELGADGHPQRGGFLPPVPLPRRMWAGGRLQFHRPLSLDTPITRTSCIRDISHKSGRSGELVFVKVGHEISDAEGVAISEEQDIVYREDEGPNRVPPRSVRAPEQAAWQRRVAPDPVLLFRYSALTFNGHRIHYDRPYATEVEGYAGLVVQGPLIATQLAELLRVHCPERRLARFEFRAVRPLLDLLPFSVCGEPDADGKTAQLWSRDAEGFVTMEATATLE